MPSVIARTSAMRPIARPTRNATNSAMPSRETDCQPEGEMALSILFNAYSARVENLYPEPRTV
jgi:hypothetical protein